MGKIHSKTSENPFAVKPLEPEQDLARQLPKIHTDISENGEIVRVKYESGVPVVVENLGTPKKYIQRVIEKAALMRPEEELLDRGELSHIELSAIKLAGRASQGDLDATKELLDRTIGKSTQHNENVNVNASLDDVLKRMET